MERKLPLLQVSFLGKGTIVYGDKAILSGKSMITRAMKLLLILIFNGEKGISRNKLIEDLFGREELSDVSNNLRVTINRLKRVLVKSGLPEYDYVENIGGKYYWNSPMETESDIGKFYELIHKASTENDMQDRLSMLKKACHIYKGEFLQRLSSDEWVMMESVQCKKMYSKALQQVCELLMEQKEYQKALDLLDIACELYPFDEWQAVKIDCLISMNQYKEAMKVYEQTVKMLVEELGIGPSPKMLEQFKNMSGHISYKPQAINEIKHVIKEDTVQEGALYCSVPGFRDACRVIRRGMERNGQSVFLMLCSLVDKKGRPLAASAKLDEIADELQEALRKSLRKSDSFTKYSQSQFLVMLVGTNEENCQIVIDRIEKKFSENHKSWVGYLDYSISSLWDVEY